VEDSKLSYEFERRFFCREIPDKYDDGLPPSLIIQNYYLSSDGYAIRVRLQADDTRITMSQQTDGIELLNNYSDNFDVAILTVKGPPAGGTRYESEMMLDPMIGKELIRRGGKPIVKNRYSVWVGTDGWVIDAFSGANYGLIIAEIERTGPVTDLHIPEFCEYEVTDDMRFSNDSLVNTPYSAFAKEFLGHVDAVSNQPQLRFSTQFGTNFSA
jgi:CYTH domain-containing protein